MKKDFFQTHQKKILIIFVIVLITSIIAILIWPLINKGTLNIYVNQANSILKICQTTTGYIGNSEYGCDPNEMSSITIANNEYSSKFKSGTYYFEISKNNFQNYSQEITISAFQTQKISINLIPLPQKVTTDHVISISSGQNTSDNQFYITDSTINNQDNNFSFVYQIRQLVNQQEQTIMTIENLAQINKTLWSPDQSQIIVWATEKNSSNTSPQKFIININQQTISKSTIPSDNIAWTPDSQHIYYVFSDIKTVDEQPPSDLPEGAGWVPTISFGTNNNMLTSANPDGSNWQNIIKLDEHNIFDPILVPSPDNNYIIIISNNHQVYIFDRQNNIVNQFATSESVTDASWSPDSQKILLETYNEKYNPQLVLTALNSNTNQSTNIQTFLSKSTWMNDHELICAIPNYLEQGPYSELPSTIDYFKIIDFNQPSNNTDYPYSTTQLNNTNQVANTAIDLSFNTNNNSLYYIDYDDILYFIPKNN